MTGSTSPGSLEVRLFCILIVLASTSAAAEPRAPSQQASAPLRRLAQPIQPMTAAPVASAPASTAEPYMRGSRLDNAIQHDHTTHGTAEPNHWSEWFLAFFTGLLCLIT